jgi:hypothetical protein
MHSYWTRTKNPVFLLIIKKILNSHWTATNNAVIHLFFAEWTMRAIATTAS